MTLAVTKFLPASRKAGGNTSQVKATCTVCGERSSISDFARDASKASGHKSLCKACDRVKSRRYYEANREKKIAAATRRYHEKKAGA